jgi:16S rRNA (cytosine1402-N4)-methyltransferase
VAAEPSVLRHVSVLLKPCLDWLNPQSGRIYVDGTLGFGGHSKAILERSNPAGKIIGFDWDARALELAAERLAFYEGRFSLQRRNFAEIGPGLDSLGIAEIDGLLVDIGLSSMQLETSGRGFTFRQDEPLDMRMDQRRQLTAASILNTASRDELADIFFYYGEERQARPIAAAVVEARKQNEIVRTSQLVELVSGAVPKKFHPRKIHVATRVFQALRIAVNGELENLVKILKEGVRYLRPGARFCIISFHSLEDRIVKRHFRADTRLRVLTPKPITPSVEEVAANPRSRSARLRVAEKQ